MSKKIWLIDENENQSKTYARKLRRVLPSTVQVERLYPPYRYMNDYVALLNEPETVCIILDQKLKDTGIATYTGIELAEYLRGVSSKLPIYILTNFPPDVKEDEVVQEYNARGWSVEDIVDKNVFTNPVHIKAFTARLLRRLEIYDDILLNRAKRFNELLRVKVAGELTQAEEKEFDQLQFERLAPEEALPESQSEDVQRIIETNLLLINSLEKLTKNKSDDL
jgi:hypothetical protein